MPGTALPIGFSGSMRVRLPVFALVAVGTVLVALVPFPHEARREVGVAGVIFFVLVAAATAEATPSGHCRRSISGNRAPPRSA